MTEYLFRASARNRAPTLLAVLATVNMYSLRPKGVSFRSGSPPGGSTMMTSAPSSEKCEEHQWPMIMFAVMSRTRMPFSDSGLSALNCCRTADSTQSEYSFRFSSTPAYTSSDRRRGNRGPGKDLDLGPLLFRTPLFSHASPPSRNLLLRVPVRGTLVYLSDCRISVSRRDRPPFREFSRTPTSLDGTFWRVEKSRRKSGCSTKRPAWFYKCVLLISQHAVSCQALFLQIKHILIFSLTASARAVSGSSGTPPSRRRSRPGSGR